MTNEEAITKALAAFDEHAAEALNSSLAMLADHGATDVELADAARWLEQENSKQRAKLAAEITAWIDQEFKSLH